MLRLPVFITIALVTLSGASSEAGVIAFTDRALFLAALSATATTDDYEAYPTGVIPNGAIRADFAYTYDGSFVQPAVTGGAFGGQALGGTPFDVFVGGDLVTLTFEGTALRAFGADFYYGPAFDVIPSDIYRVRIDDGAGAASFAGNGALDPQGGAFFLGLIADAGFEFTMISLLSVVPTDANGDPIFLVPAYQVDNLAYRHVDDAIPEPSVLALLLSGTVGALGARRRCRRARAR